MKRSMCIGLAAGAVLVAGGLLGGANGGSASAATECGLSSVVDVGEPGCVELTVLPLPASPGPSVLDPEAFACNYHLVYAYELLDCAEAQVEVDSPSVKGDLTTPTEPSGSGMMGFQPPLWATSSKGYVIFRFPGEEPLLTWRVVP